jgi:hypothetical protein
LSLQIYPTIYLTIHPSIEIYLSILPSIYPSIYPSRSIHPSIHPDLSNYLSIYPSRSVHPSIHLSIHPDLSHTIHHDLHPSTYPPIYLSIYLTIGGSDSLDPPISDFRTGTGALEAAVFSPHKHKIREKQPDLWMLNPDEVNLAFVAEAESASERDATLSSAVCLPLGKGGTEHVVVCGERRTGARK